MRWTALALVPLAACSGAHDDRTASPGTRIEASAIAAGMIADPAHTPITGVWSRDSDRMCVGNARDGQHSVGLAIDYGEGQGCLARGTAARDGARIELTLGACMVAAHFEGDRIVLPAELPADCDRYCTGRASLGAMAVDRQSESPADAAAMAAPDGSPLCAGGG